MCLCAHECRFYRGIGPHLPGAGISCSTWVLGPGNQAGSLKEQFLLLKAEPCPQPLTYYVFICLFSVHPDQFPLPPFLPHTPCLSLTQIHSSLLSLQKGAGLLGTPTEHASPLFLTDTKISVSILLMYSFAFSLFKSEFSQFFLCSICIGFLCFSGHGIRTPLQPTSQGSDPP